MKKDHFLASKIFPILLINFIGILGYSLVIPILIFIVSDLGGNGFIYGILGAMYPLFQFIGAPILGRLSDNIGRRKVLIISQLGTFTAWILFIVALLLPKTELWAQNSNLTGSYIMTIPLACIFLARILDGFTGGNISVANAYLSDISSEEDRSQNFGKMATSSSLGLVIGPALAGILASTVLGSLLPIILAALISLIAIFVIKKRLKDHNQTAVDVGEQGATIRNFLHAESKDCFHHGKKKAAHPKIGWKSVLNISGVPNLYGIYFFTYLGFSLFYSGLPIYVNTALNWTAGDLGLYLAVSSLIMVLVQGPVLSYLTKAKKIANSRLIGAGAFLLMLSFFTLTIEGHVGIYGANILLSVGNGLMWPSFLAVLSEKGEKNIQGSIQGYGTSMGSLASMIGLVVGGILFESIGTNLFIIAGIIFTGVVLLSVYNLKKSTEISRPD